jgi:isopropylmalate/homocitrate/citramalate synthase
MNEPNLSVGRWYSSPWNFLPGVLDSLNLPARVTFHDITLRDGEQQAGIALRRGDKVDIARKLAQAGVDRIEAGMPIVTPDDEAAIKDIVQLDLGPDIYAFARCMAADVQKAKDCGVHGVVVEIPSSMHLVELGYGWKFDRAIELSIDATLAAKDAGLRTVFFTIDSSRAEMDWYLDLIERVATEGHMDALTLVDTFGVVSPHAIPLWVAKVRERLPDVSLEAHFHDDFGLAVANTIAAITAGCDVVHTTVSGVGERAGNCPMEDLAMALRVLYGVEHNLDTTQFYSLSRLVRERTGHAIPSNRAVVGDRLFEVESGIIAGWHNMCIDDHPLELFPYHWDEVGQGPARVVFGKGSGLPSLDRVPGIGPDAGEELRREVLARIKQRGLETKALLSYEEVLEIVREATA